MDDKHVKEDALLENVCAVRAKPEGWAWYSVAHRVCIPRSHLKVETSRM